VAEDRGGVPQRQEGRQGRDVHPRHCLKTHPGQYNLTHVPRQKHASLSGEARAPAHDSCSPVNGLLVEP
jgi:hypothetical protein